MLQRKQSLWLLLALIASVLSFKFPFLTGTKNIKAVLTSDVALKADSHFLLLIFSGAAALLAGATIFLYKDRKLQLRLCLLGILLSVTVIAIYIMQMQQFEKSTLALFSILPFVVLAGFFMAFRGIRSDEKLVKSLDKLR